jgi:predicted secreted protein
MFLAMLVFALHPIGALILTVLLLAGLKASKIISGIHIAKWFVAIVVSLGPLFFGTTVAYPGYGSHLATAGSGGTSAGPFTNVGQLKKFAFNGLKADFDEITNLDSPSIFKEWMKTTVDGSDITFDGVLNPVDTPTQQLLSNIATSGSTALWWWQITTTDGSTFKFQAYVAEFKFGAEYNKAITFSGSLKIVGNITTVWS